MSTLSFISRPWQACRNPCRSRMNAPRSILEGTAIVLEEAARAGVKKLIFSSSAAIYGDNPTNPKIESMPAEPKSPYATSKYEAERHCRSFTDEGRLATVSLRYFNVFGPYQDPRSEYSAVVPAFIVKAIEKRADYDFRRRPADARLHLCKRCSRSQCVLRVKIAGNWGLQRRLRQADHNNRSGPNDSQPYQV